MKAIGLMVAAVLAAAPAALAAEGMGKVADRQTVYFGFGGALNLQGDSDVEGTGINRDASFDTGWAAIVTFGKGFDKGIRAEVELGHRHNEVDSGPGHSGAWSGMGNLLLDIDTGTPIKPYIGVGLGMANVRYDGLTEVGGSRLNDSDLSFAYQGIVGATYGLNEYLDLFADYRYFATPDLDMRTDSGASVDASYSNHTLMAGLRWYFHGQPPRTTPTVQPEATMAPPPLVREPTPPPIEMPKRPEPQAAAAPPPAPAPTPEARTYLVFFDWDKADLTPEALGILARAAENAKQATTTRVIATGHADRSGPAPYNLRLSSRRAIAVRAQLVRSGIPETEIGIVAKGETEPLVPTADGVREPQNRRVQIVLE